MNRLEEIVIEIAAWLILIAVISGCAWGWSIALEEMETTPDHTPAKP